MQFDKIFENNQQWISEKLKLDPEYFDKISKGQSPEILYIGCSDSRVTAEELMGASPGELFVHRNIANMVVSIDLNAISVITYAITHLKVKHVVVCGHYECGGVRAAMKSVDLGLLNPWLRNIRDVYRLHFDELEAIKDEQERFKRLVELNVQEQCINVIKTTAFQEAFHNREIDVYGWVFNIYTGQIVDLKIDFKAILKNVMKVYALYKPISS